MRTIERVEFDDMTRYFTEEATDGAWSVGPFEMTEKEVKWAQLQGMMHAGQAWMVMSLKPGRYVRLTCGHEVVMSTTPWEQQTNCDVVREARGRVLLAGLGLGMTLLPIMRKPEVESVLVLEKAPEVIRLIKPRLPLNKKVEIVEADAFTWKPVKLVHGIGGFSIVSSRFDTIYFDIWANVSSDNAAEIGRLHKRYQNWKAPGGWMASWLQDVVRAKRDQDRRPGDGRTSSCPGGTRSRSSRRSIRAGNLPALSAGSSVPGAETSG